MINLLIFTLTILADQLMQRVKISKDVNTSTSIQVSRLEEPQVVALKVTDRHAVLGCSALFEVEGFKFSNLVHTLS